MLDGRRHDVVHPRLAAQAEPRPRPSRRIEGTRELAGEDLPCAALADHRVEVGPRPERKQRVGFARRVAEGRPGRESEQPAAQLGVELADEGRAPELIERVRGRPVAGPVEPVRRAVHLLAARGDGVDEPGQAEREIAGHARIGGGRAGEHERQLSVDGALAEGDALRWRPAPPQPALRRVRARGELVAVGRDEHQPGRPGVGLAPRLERDEGPLAIATGVHVEPRRCFDPQPRHAVSAARAAPPAAAPPASRSRPRRGARRTRAWPTPRAAVARGGAARARPRRRAAAPWPRGERRRSVRDRARRRRRRGRAWRRPRPRRAPRGPRSRRGARRPGA